MPKFALLALVLPLLFAPAGSVLAQEQLSSAEAVNYTFELPTSPLDGLINEWFGEDKLKSTVQQGMNQAQSGIQEATGQALGTAQDAIKDEISRQANKAIQDAKEKAEGYVGGVVATIKAAVNDLIAKIKLFFVELFTKPAPTY